MTTERPEGSKPGCNASQWTKGRLRKLGREKPSPATIGGPTASRISSVRRRKRIAVLMFRGVRLDTAIRLLRKWHHVSAIPDAPCRAVGDLRAKLVGCFCHRRQGSL